MNYNLKGTSISLSPEVHTYLDKKLLHVERFLSHEPTSTLDIDLTYDPGVVRTRYQATFKLLANKQILYTQARGDTLHEAIDLAVAEFIRDAVKVKGKQHHTLRQRATRIKDFFRGFKK